MALFLSNLLGLAAEDETVIEIARVERSDPVDFEAEVMPILRKNCLACHNQSRAKADLVLETPETMREGGSFGPAIDLEKSEQSLLLLAASHREEPYMPPEDNDVGARNLTSAELGLIKLWIDQGAKASSGRKSATAEWHRLPPGIERSLAVALAEDGSLVAASRANRIFVYDLGRGRLEAELRDPALVERGIYDAPGVAHLDNVQALDFHPSGELLASSGYRTVKLWRRLPHLEKGRAALGEPAALLTTGPDGEVLVGAKDGSIHRLALPGKGGEASAEEVAGEVGGALAAVARLDRERLAAASNDGMLRVVRVGDGKVLARAEFPSPARALVALEDGKRVLAGSEDGVLRIATVAEKASEEKSEESEGGEKASEEKSEAKAKDAGEEPEAAGGDEGAAKGSEAEKAAEESDGAEGSFEEEEPAEPPLAVSLVELAKHGGAVNAVALVPGAEKPRIVSGSEDGKVRLIEVEGAKEVRSFEHGSAVRAVAVSPDGKRLVSAGADGVAKLWDLESGKELQAMSGDFRAKRLLAHRERRAKVFESRAAAAKKAVEEAEKELAKKEEEIKKASDELASAEKDLAEKENALGKAEDKKKAEKERDDAKGKVENARRKVEDLTADRDRAKGRLEERRGELVVEEEHRDAAAAARDEARKAVEAEAPPLDAVAFSADGTLVVTAGSDGSLRVWSGADGSALEAFRGNDGPVAGVLFIGEDIVSLAEDGSLVRWASRPGWVLERTIGDPEDGTTFADRVTALDFSPDGGLLVTGGGEPSRQGELKVWKVEDGTLVREIVDAHSDTVFAAEFSFCGRYLASSGADRFAKSFRLADGELLAAYEGHTHHVLGVSWSADGKTIATCGADNVIKVWNADTREVRRTIGGFGKQVTDVEFVGDSENVVSSSGDRNVRLHRTGNGRQERSFGGADDFVYSVAATPDGKTIAAGDYRGVIRVWDGENGKLLHAFEPGK